MDIWFPEMANWLLDTWLKKKKYPVGLKNTWFQENTLFTGHMVIGNNNV